MEHAMQQANAERYLSLFDEIMRKVNDNDVALVVIHEVGKDGRLQVIQSSRGSSGNQNVSETQASGKRKSYLRRLGVSFDESISKAEASRLIDENM
jgi:hypothetical protein